MANTGLLLVVGILGVSAIGFFMFRDKIMEMFGGGLDLGLAPPIEAGGGGPEIPMLKEEMFPNAVSIYPTDEIIRYYAERVAAELNKYQGDKLTMTRKLNIEAYAIVHYKSDLEKIARLQGYEIKALNGEALTIFSKLVLTIANRVGMDRLPNRVVERLRANVGHGDMGYTYPDSEYILKNTFMRPS